ncbi:nucleoside triphosphate pyrophosphohydrolase [Alphaproteobacteria bacterium]|nr:nucleoside triphosphate pyrophosphohydrolase [Alphaproteobacteria bacterium]
MKYQKNTSLNIEKITENITELVHIMERLRDKENGCEWDVQQTYDSIAPYTIEESYEVVEAIYEKDMTKLCDELGDLLLQVVFHSQIAHENNHFQLQDVISSVCKKMVRRHPHIFGDIVDKNVTSIRKSWEDIKQKEREKQSKNKDNFSLLDGISTTLPAVTRAMKLQQRAAKIGFDWPNIDSVFDKMHEEIEELKMEFEQGQIDQTRVQDEVGDILFVATNISRVAGFEPETSLILANRKFESRFKQMEKQAKLDNQKLENLTLEQLENYWQLAKKSENK